MLVWAGVACGGGPMGGVDTMHHEGQYKPVAMICHVVGPGLYQQGSQRYDNRLWVLVGLIVSVILRRGRRWHRISGVSYCG